MDHILENEGKSVPDLSTVSGSSSSSAPPMDVDPEDEEDAEALRALTGKAGASGADLEARVMPSAADLYGLKLIAEWARASNVQNAVKYSRTPHLPTFTLRKVDMINLKNRLKK